MIHILNQQTVGRQIGTGFAIILIILTAMVLICFSGIRTIVHDAAEVIEGNRLDAVLAQTEVDHLNWSNRLHDFLGEGDVRTEELETDHRLCPMGQWLYGEERKQLEKQIPSLKKLLAETENPHKRLHDSAGKIVDIYIPADEKLPAFLAAGLADHLEWAGKIRSVFLQNSDKPEVEISPRKCRLGQWIYSEETRSMMRADTELAALFAQLEIKHQQLHESAAEIQENYRRIHPGLAQKLYELRDTHHHIIWQTVSSIYYSTVNHASDTGEGGCALNRWFASEEARKLAAVFPPLAKAEEALGEPHSLLHKSLELIREELDRGDKGKAEWFFVHMTLPAYHRVNEICKDILAAENELLEGRKNAMRIYHTKTEPLLEEISGLLIKMQKTAEKKLEARKAAYRIYSEESLPALKEVQELLHRIRSEARKHILTDEKMLISAADFKRNISISGLAACLAGILLAFLIRRSIVRQIQQISHKLENGAEQLASASSQVADTAHALSEGSSEQAASLEQTAATLEEMSAAISGTARLTRGAQELMNENISKSARSLKALVDLTRNVDKIEDDSGEIGDVIKMIDDIAFQTDLLALNASVEAARSGEAGSGFAVVANEVRNLAVRTTRAAENTQQLLEGMVKRIAEGAEALKRMSEDFDGIVKSASRMGEKTSSITLASKENASGIEQLNLAVQQMDTVTQQNAGIAEESAAAAEELNSLADNMLDIVKDLSLLAGKTSSGKIRR